jgi:hypothetical protein
MRIRTKLATVEKRMRVRDLGRDCPLCRTRPVEVIYCEEQEVLPSQAPPCPLCGKGPKQIVIQFV